MSRTTAITCWSKEGHAQVWQPTTLDKLGKSEEFFESVLAETPELLGIRSRRSGIHGPYAVFRQLEMTTPSRRAIYPDIGLLSASGHVVVVEIKRGVNPELRDRAVIAQIIDYASSFAAMTEQDALKLFGGERFGAQTWGDLIAGLVPEDDRSDELAEVLFGRMTSGELNLLIACDKVPPGLPEIVAGIASQHTLGFALDLVEVVPFVREGMPADEILFVPTIRLATEIVARSAIPSPTARGKRSPTRTSRPAAWRTSSGRSNQCVGQPIRWLGCGRPLMWKQKSPSRELALHRNSCSSSRSIRLTGDSFLQAESEVRPLRTTWTSRVRME